MMIEGIVAMGENRVIGVNNELPWHLSEDLKHFKRITMGKAILMGRKTYESIGHPLPGRVNIVLTSDPAFVAPSCMVVNSIDEAIKMGESMGSLVVIGGQTIYEQMIDNIDILHVTQVHVSIEGDAFFPEISQSEWHEALLKRFEKNDKNEYNFSFKTYTKKSIDSIQHTSLSL